MLNKNFQTWFDLQKANNKIIIKIIKLKNLNGWYYTKDKIYHKSKKFFKIIGIDVKSNIDGNWDQPIIVQNEVGILGIIKNKFKKKYLLQAKVEPGNINKLQLSPTVQATRSNYERVHGGKKIPFLKLFIDKKKSFIGQPEQGYRYLFKSNNNSLIEITKPIKVMKNFYWFSKEELKTLIKKRNILSMDTISVFSSLI